jgi:hypothetical protein
MALGMPWNTTESTARDAPKNSLFAAPAIAVTAIVPNRAETGDTPRHGRGREKNTPEHWKQGSTTGIETEFIAHAASGEA